MKRLFIISLVMAVSSCYTTRPTDSLEDSMMIKIECKDDMGLQQSIINLLKSIGAKDIIIDRLGYFLNIKAAYLNRDNPHGKIEDVGRKINDMPNVLFVEIEKNRSIVRQTF